MIIMTPQDDQIARSEGVIAFTLNELPVSYIVSDECDFMLDGYHGWFNPAINTTDIPFGLAATDHWVAEHTALYVLSVDAMSALEDGSVYCFQGPDFGKLPDREDVDEARIAADGTIHMGDMYADYEFFSYMEHVDVDDVFDEPVSIYMTIGD